MKLTLPILIVTALVLAARAGDPPADARNDDLKRLQGRWTLVSYIVNGNLQRGAELGSFIEIDGDRFTSRFVQPDSSPEKTAAGTVKLSETGPKQIDFVHVSGPHKGSISRVLYQIVDDQLRYVHVVFPENRLEPLIVQMTYRRHNPDTLAIDVHDGSAGPPAWNRNFTYSLATGTVYSAADTVIRFRVNTTTAANTYGEIMIDTGKDNWTYAGEWTPRKLEAAQKTGDWLTLDLAALPQGFKTDTLRVRFDYKAGVALECYEVEWRHKNKAR